MEIRGIFIEQYNGNIVLVTETGVKVKLIYSAEEVKLNTPVKIVLELNSDIKELKYI